MTRTLSRLARIGPVTADPYPWPYDGTVPADRAALICIDWQVDFCGPGGYVERMGYDIELTRAGLPAAARMLAHARAIGMLVIHTREGHAPDLSDLPANKRWRSAQIGAEIGGPGPRGRILVRGEPGWEIVHEVAPLPGEVVIDKPGKGSFYATDLHQLLQAAGITSLVVTGVTTEVCVHSTVREANDRGYECLVLADCVGSYFPEFQQAGLAMITAQGGIFGWVAPSAAYLDSLSAVNPTAAGAATDGERS
ncbi:MAG: cysteine hydrolase family protein [Pseudonocardiales bacterium]